MKIINFIFVFLLSIAATIIVYNIIGYEILFVFVAIVFTYIMLDIIGD